MAKIRAERQTDLGTEVQGWKAGWLAGSQWDKLRHANIGPLKTIQRQVGPMAIAPNLNMKLNR
jgi:hypothetical protein